ncbi:MAG: sensor histidine kinase [Acidimicrobiales bacterium]
MAAFRWAAWAWMVTVLVVSRHSLDQPALAVALVAVALVVTAVTSARRGDARALLAPAAVAGELAVGAALLVGSGIAYREGHAFASGAQSLGSAWPLAGVLSAGLALGGVAGAVAGAAIGLSRLGGVVLGGVPGGWDGGRVLSIVSTTVLYALAGGAAGFAAASARRAEREIASVRAREEVARHLHDGVLQTLAVVQRRASDVDLARLAHRQERELRAYLAGDLAGSDDLATSLRRAAAWFEDAFGGRAEVVVAGEVPRRPGPAGDAVIGAVTEALANAGKHGEATRVTVYVEPGDDGSLFCSVKDDGAGFDPATVVEGVGLPRSIRGRMAEVGGRAEIDSRPGRGTEVRLFLGRP